MAIRRLEFDPERFSTDPRYAREFVAQESPFVYKTCRRYATDNDHAADLHQASWAKLCEAAYSYSRKGSFRGWFYKIIRSVCVDDYKKRRNETEDAAAYADELRHESRSSSPMDPFSLAEQEDQCLAFDEAVETLPPKQRRVVLLRLVEKMTTEETAELLGVSRATVRSHLSHAMPALVAYMRDRRPP